jgi:signal transduction histidine kinase
MLWERNSGEGAFDVTAASPGTTNDDRIAEEQAALRRVATLVARGTPPEEVFGAVAEEVGRLLAADFATLGQYDGARDAVAIAGLWTSTGAPAPTPVGGRLPLGGHNVATRVYRTGHPARIDYSGVSGVIGDVAIREWGLRSSVGVPVSVEGRLWGVMVVAFTREHLLAADTEARLAGFTELAATAIANAQARGELRSFAAEQAALLHVATLVARAAAPEQVFAAVAEEAGQVLDAAIAILARYDLDGATTAVGTWTSTGVAFPPSVGSRTGLGGRNVSTLVFQTGRPARIDDYADASGPVGNVAREVSIRASVGVPVRVEGRLWGVMIVASTQEPVPAGTEDRLAGFTELVAAAIASAEARAGLRSFAAEQAALRRVAVLVARAAPPKVVFASVAQEAGRLLKAAYAMVSRYDGDGLATFVGGWTATATDPDRPLPIGLQLKLEGRNVHTLVFQRGRPTRIDDYDAASGAWAEVARDWEYRSSVGVPISVEGQLWGVMLVGSNRESLPAGTEDRLAGFTELVATALANAEARDALTASRARIVSAADQTRRRIERNLHDGAQQRLVSLTLRLRAAQAAAPPEAAELADRLEGAVTEANGVLEELREIARGLHPAILTESGLRPALRALARRSAVPVSLHVKVGQRLPEAVEIAAYYAVAEALTNTAKHAQASTAEVELATGDDMLLVRVRDDGLGGASFGPGSGLAGLRDRAEALGGRIQLDSPRGAGTTVRIVLPLGGPGEPGSG